MLAAASMFLVPKTAGDRVQGIRQPVLACQVAPGLGSVAVAVTEVRSISQTCGVPLTFWNKMSVLRRRARRERRHRPP